MQDQALVYVLELCAVPRSCRGDTSSWQCGWKTAHTVTRGLLQAGDHGCWHRILLRRNRARLCQQHAGRMLAICC